MVSPHSDSSSASRRRTTRAWDRIKACQAAISRSSSGAWVVGLAMRESLRRNTCACKDLLILSFTTVADTIFGGAMTTTADTSGTVVETLTGDYQIDPTHSRLGFAAKHAMVATVRGQFKIYSGEVHLDEENPAASRVSLQIEVGSVDTGNADRDKHLLGPDFFDVETYPTITFTSTNVEKVDDDVYTLIGDLTINDKTNPVAVEFELTGTSPDPWGNFRVGFEGRATVNRRDWDLAWNVALDKGGVLVSEKVKLEFDIAAVKQVAQS